MDSVTDDVVVVGGRVRGSTDRHAAGARWALRTAPGAIRAAGRRLRPLDQAGRSCPAAPVEGAGDGARHRLDDRVLWLDGKPQHAPAVEPGTGPIAPRRTVLDPILLTAAAPAGAEVEMGVSVHGLLRQGERVTGVTTSAGERRARLVISADGRNSRIARLAGAKTYHDHPPVTFAYYTYWRGCLVTGVHAWPEPGRFFGTFPVGGGLALAFVQGPRGEYPAFRSNPLTAYISELRSRPALAGLLADAVIAEPLRGTAALPTFFRMSSGPGWALVGEAGYHKDPRIARGIADAFRDADLVATAVADGSHGDLEAALAEYGRQRDQCAIPPIRAGFRATCRTPGSRPANEPPTSDQKVRPHV